MQKIIIAASIFSRSGYGDHARSICKALIQNPDYDVKIIPFSWGTTPDNALDRNDPENSIYFDRIVSDQIDMNNKPDIFIHVTIPPDFQPAGVFSIGITAGIECTKMRPDWIDSCNKMDLVITTSNFSAEVFKINKFEKRNKETNAVENVLELKTPIEVLFEGLDPSFSKTDSIHKSIQDVMRPLPDFNFLFCGHWLQGLLGHDRKDVGMLVKTFLDTFKRKSSKNRPGLILKTGLAGFSITEREVIRDKIEQIHDLIREEGWKRDLPDVYILNGELTVQEMNSLYNHPKVKAMISFTHGEGYGRPLLEFTATGKPVIAPQWSGQLDFLHPEYSFLLPGQLIDVHPSAKNEWITDGKWFQVNYGIASQVMLNCHSNYSYFTEKSRKHKKFTLDHFSETPMANKLNDILSKYASTTKSPQVVRKITLPKLTKVT